MRRLVVVLAVVATVAGGLVETGELDLGRDRGGTVSMPEPGTGADEGGDAATGANAEAADRLAPTMVRAFGRAQQSARAAGVELVITSGWRSRDHQQALFDEAVAKYGSVEAARQWVLPPGESAHVRGEAIDVGPAAGAEWLRVNGVRYGLCQVYANEAWHFERLAPAIGQDCPSLRPHA